MKHIGLLMVRNEEDVLLESLEHHSQYFDTIVAQDGSDDGGRDMIEACPNVVKCFHDEDVLEEGERWTDGHRNVAMQWILREFGCENVWLTLLHADEFWFDNPIAEADHAHADGATYVMWGEFRFFLHTSDKTTLDPSKPVTERVTWWSGPYFEDRQFKLENHQFYAPGKDHCVIPAGPPPHRRWQHRVPRYRHYPYRSKDQCRNCWFDKCEQRYWQPDHGWLGIIPGAPFVPNLGMPSNSPLAAWPNLGQFDGDLPDAKPFLPDWWKG